MIKFSAWNIDAIGSPLGRQYDNLTRSLDIVGNIPDGWTWNVLLQIGDNLNIISLSPSEEGLHATLTADMLAIKGKYRLQLRASQADKIRHTNIITVDVLESISGDAKWPEVPSEFTQLEQRVQALAAETETAAAQAKDAAEGVAANAQAAQEAAGQAQTAQDAAQSSAQQAGTAATAAADGAKTAADSATAAQQAAQSAGDAVSSAQASAQTATEQAQSAAAAAQQAGQAKTAAEAAAGSAEQSAQEAKAAAAVLPIPTKDAAGMVPAVNKEGNGYELVPQSGGGTQNLTLALDETLTEPVSKITANFSEANKIYFELRIPKIETADTALYLSWKYLGDKYDDNYILTVIKLSNEQSTKISGIVELNNGMLSIQLSGATDSAIPSTGFIMRNPVGNLANVLNVTKAIFTGSSGGVGDPQKLVQFSFVPQSPYLGAEFSIGTIVRVWVGG